MSPTACGPGTKLGDGTCDVDWDAVCPRGTRVNRARDGCVRAEDRTRVRWQKLAGSSCFDEVIDIHKSRLEAAEACAKDPACHGLYKPRLKNYWFTSTTCCAKDDTASCSANCDDMRDAVSGSRWTKKEVGRRCHTTPGDVTYLKLVS